MILSDMNHTIHEAIDYVKEQSQSDDAFMGRTHALSAVALILLIFCWKPLMYVRLSGGSKSLVILAMFCLVSAGGALLPDLDNTQSTAKSSLGATGSLISSFMRATSPLIQNTLRTKYDKPTDDAHRGFYHTILAGLLFGALFTFLCSPAIAFHIGSFVVNGKLVALILMFLSVDMALSAILGEMFSSKKGMDTVISLAFSFGLSWMIWSNLPNGASYTMIGLALGLGWIIHILGDMFTTAGVPALFPIKIKGKFWYNIRFLKIQAGGLIENFFFTPLFLIVIVVSIFTIAHVL